MSAERRRRRSRRRLIVTVGVLAVVAILVAVGVWILVRGWLAREALLEAEPLLRELADTVAEAPDPESIDADLARIAELTARAAALTSDPVWRAGEILPVVGADLAAVRHTAAAADLVVREALPPLRDLAGRLDDGSLAPVDGHLDLAALAEAQPAVAAADAGFAAAAEELRGVSGSGLIPAVDDAVDRVRELVRSGGDPVAAAADATRLLPAMLGDDGPRDYLLLVQNNAELRAAGGIPGAVAVVHAEGGTLTIGPASTAFSFPAPVAPLTPAESVLFGPGFARYLQNTTMTPDFARTAELAREMWRQRTGVTVDGVISVDPGALAQVLEATGPIVLPDGTRLESDTAVATLLSDTYRRFARPADQDAFFASAAGAVFDRVVAGGYSARHLVAALAEATAERRVLIWAARPEEEQVIAGTPVAGSPPRGPGELGVYFVDNTEGKMDVYLRASIEVRGAQCRADGRPDLEVAVALESTAPPDAATSLPAYVLGGRPGLAVLPGQIRTTAFVYAPAGSEFWDVARDGDAQAFIAAADDRNSVAGLTATLDPGERTVIVFHLIGPAAASTSPSVDTTPMVAPTPVRLGALAECPDPGAQLPQAGAARVGRLSGDSTVWAAFALASLGIGRRRTGSDDLRHEMGTT